MEQELLKAFQSALKSLGINGHFRFYKGKTYPYLTYEYYENNITHEDGGTDGELLCEIWTRGKYSELTGIKEQLKNYFKQKNIKVGNNIYHLDYASSSPEDTGDAELKKLAVSITVRFWKGA